MKYRLKTSVYALEAVGAPVDLYIRLGAPAPRLKPLPQATITPVTQACRDALCQRAAAELQGQPHELVRIDA